MTFDPRTISRTRTLAFPDARMAQATLEEVQKHPSFVFGFINAENAVEAFFRFRGEFVDIPKFGVAQEAFAVAFPPPEPAAPASFPPEFARALSSILTGKSAT